MIDLEKMVSLYVKDGYSELFAEARVCQDIVLKAGTGLILSLSDIDGGVSRSRYMSLGTK